MRRLALAALVVLAFPASALADHTQESISQDDQFLLYSSTATVSRTLGTLRSLGVDRVRITVKWSAIAPDPSNAQRPAGFDATNPAAYPASGWAPYDRVVELAKAHGIAVQFNVTAPGPVWAMRSGAPIYWATVDWAPDSASFAQFVDAVGTRYSGTYAGLPRVSSWSIWNEPNQPAWLAPQSYPGAAVSAWLYRLIVQAGFTGLYASGHTLGSDTILIGELAPEGYEQPGRLLAMTPMVFMRALYCVDRHFHRLRGVAASRVGCPTTGSARSFVKANLGLFSATGFAHHPYYLFFPPNHGASNPDYVPLANLHRLESGLDRAFRTYGVHGHLPIYITEYGYQTNPPDPTQRVTTAEQAVYINQADYLAWRNPRVRSVAQFLLRDSPPNTNLSPSDPQYWDSFQTGLEFVNGRHKPAYAAYRMPIWIPAFHGRRAFVWGQVRPAFAGATALIQWARRHGRWRTLAHVRTVDRFIAARVRLPGTGLVRIKWGRLMSRAVAVR